MTSRLYLGPYNDPVATNGNRHWISPHDADFRNPAFDVDMAGGTYTASVVVRSTDVTFVSPSDVTVDIYAIRAPQFNLTRVKIQNLATKLLGGTLGSQIPATTQTQFIVGAVGVPCYSRCFDQYWVAGPVTFALPGKGVLLVAKLTSATWGLQPVNAAELDPCVAIWVGP